LDGRFGVGGGGAAVLAADGAACDPVVADGAAFCGALCSKGSTGPIAFVATAGLGDVEDCDGSGAAKAADTLATMARLSRESVTAPVLIIGSPVSRSEEDVRQTLFQRTGKVSLSP
jgi:hypothetical protein